MIYFLSISFTVWFALYTKYQISDDRGYTQGKWHPYGLLIRWTFFAALYLIGRYPSPLEDYILAGTINILLWEISVNILALQQKWHHVGTTSNLDKWLGKKKWLVYFVLLAGAITFKILHHEGGGEV